MSNQFDYDVIVIGAGPAGSKCAIELGKAGKKVACVEKDAVGGVCLNRGCIPSKTYLYMVEMLESFKKAKRHGIEVGDALVVWEAAKKRKDQNVKMLGMGLTKQMECAGVEIIQGTATFEDPHTLKIEGEENKTISAEHIVIATGTRPLFIPIMPKGEHVISSTEILNLPELPKSLAIIGGGVTGVEMASIFTALGTEVTIIEKLDTLLPAQDREITAALRKSLEKKKCKILLETEVVSAKDAGDGAEVVYKTADGEETLAVDKALIVIGRTVNYSLEEFDKIGIKHDGRRVELDVDLKTSLPHVYLIGDGAFRNLTAYGAEREAEVVASAIGGTFHPIDYDAMPVTVFSHPEVGQIGLTEARAKELGVAYRVLKSDYAANAKAVIMGARDGFVKILVEDETEKILGVHVIGVHATDLAHQAFLPVVQGMTVTQWRQLVWSHPVLSEIFKTALESAPCSD